MVNKIVNLAKKENYLTMEATEIMHEENEIFLEELKDGGTYLSETAEKILDITKQIELHRESVVARNMPPTQEPQEVFEIEPAEGDLVSVKMEGDEDKVKIEKREHRPKIVKVELRPVSDSSPDDDPTVQKYTKVQKVCDKKRGKYVCQLCQDTFHTLQDLQDHVATHEKVTFKCNICGKKSKSKRSLANHIRRHNEMYTCALCDKKYTSKSSLWNHQRAHTGQIDVCKKCKKSFENHALYLEHINYAHAEQPTVQCAYCGQYYWTPTQRDNHVRAKHTKVAKAPKRKASSTVSRAPDDDEHQQPVLEQTETVPEAPATVLETHEGDTDEGPIVE